MDERIEIAMDIKTNVTSIYKRREVMESLDRLLHLEDEDDHEASIW